MSWRSSSGSRDRPGGQAAAGPRPGEVVAPLPDLLAVRSRFGVGEEQRPRPRVVAVLRQQVADLSRRAWPARTARVRRPARLKVPLRQNVAGVQRQLMQIFGRKIRPEVRAVAPQRPVVHQGVLEEHLLAGGDVRAGEERVPACVHDLFRDRRSELVRVHGDPDEHGESGGHDEQHAVAPAAREFPIFILHAGFLRMSSPLRLTGP